MITGHEKKALGGISTQILNGERSCRLVTLRGYKGRPNLSTTVIYSNSEDYLNNTLPKPIGVFIYDLSIDENEIYKIHHFIAEEIDKKLETSQMINDIVGDIALNSSGKFTFHEGYSPF